MAQLPPSAVFGAVRPGRAVHVLLLIENSLPMMDHWQDLQRHILPGVLGAVRIANPGVNVQIFWETTGKTQDQRAPAHKTQRHFNDFPDIDIVGMPKNRLSPHFIRQSIDLFLLGNNQKLSVTRHLFIVAMSNPTDDSSGKPDNKQNSQTDDAKWEAVAAKLQENDIFLHIIVNPLARLTRLFALFRKTMRYQSRQEVIPWQPVDTSHCVCHLSGSIHAANTQDLVSEEWPEVHLISPESPQPTANSPLDMSDEELPSPISPIDMINSNSGSLSLVSRMQALHGLANRRRPLEGRRRPSVTRASFFRETSPAPSPRRERLVSNKNGNKEKEKLRQLSMATGSGVTAPSFSSALDLRGLTQQPGLISPVDEPLANGSDSYASSSANTSPQRVQGLLSSSPGSDASGSALSTLSPLSHRNIDKTFIESESRQTPLSNGQAQSISYPLKYGRPAQVPAGQYFAGPSSPSNTLQADPSLPISPILYQAPIAGPLPYGSYSTSSISSLPSYAQFPTYSSAIPEPLAFAGNLATSTPLGAVASSSSSQLSALDDDLDDDVVPASAPPDSRGQVPFVFDAAYEAQSVVRLRRAIDSMHEGDVVQSSTLANEFGSASNGVSMNWDEDGFIQGNPEFSSAVSQDYFSYDRVRNDGKYTNSYSLSPAEQYV